MLHIMVDLYGCNPELLASETYLREVLAAYPARIGMDQVSPVELYDIKTSTPEDDGMSGFVIIATSHISLHAWPPYKMLNLDVFSCEYFDAGDVVNFARIKFQARDVEIHAVERATRSPRPAIRAGIRP